MPALNLREKGAQNARFIRIGEQLHWLDDARYEEWDSVVLRTRPLGMDDPILADVYYGISSADELKGAKRYTAGDQTIGLIYWVDGRIGLISAAAGNPVYVIERKLHRSEALQLEQSLVTRGFDPGKVDGVIDAATRAAINSYLESTGLPYRYETPVITEQIYKSITQNPPHG
ncbi:hypothetical protein DDZ13_00095 [Coraliomargarita sinensis]|uniref:Peptidoglycan binding-like domain-containing protein n=1 Tax=Coraliomargarita sinensis TaxID=2174842 RepID=A0A317ZIG5_9BACT|nr:hypothetical protein [Coraliomargarita sinensis]PXA05300.1 hypothetical protein DDZ13_00095 [Coraliomargarita sinensis]